MKYSRDVQNRDTTNVELSGLNFDALRGEIDVVNRKIVELVALRMQLFVGQTFIP